MTRLVCGEPWALDPLYRRHKGPVYRFALLWSGSAATAADVTQDVFVHLLRHAGDYDAVRGALAPWLLGIARNFVRRRTGTREVAPDTDDDTPPPAAIEHDTPESALVRGQEGDDGDREVRVQVLRMGGGEGPTLGFPTMLSLPMLPRGKGETKALGSRDIGGVKADGTQTTHTIPAGEIGNEKPIVMASERWFSPELHVVIFARTRDPRVCETSYRLPNLRREEPPAELEGAGGLQVAPVDSALDAERACPPAFACAGAAPASKATIAARKQLARYNAEVDSALVDRLDAALPQTQCTRCGYDACRPYAEAIARGEADIDRCPPGGETTIVALASLAGLAGKPLDAACGVHAPLKVAVIDEARCIGCTLCIDACPVDAILGAAKRMHAIVPSLCSGCELCLAPCPVDCIRMADAGREWTAQDAGAARARHRARQQRLARGEDVERRGRVAETGNAAVRRQRAVAEALERARMRRAATPPRPK